MNSKIIKLMYKYENNICEYATKDSEYIRLKPEEEDIRSPFFRDIDRIIYSLSYVKCIDKTMTYSFNETNFISQRMVHVQLVSKIARTIGRALNLNEDLIEAIALGHDLGHPPLGHEGERNLNEICIREKIGKFNHCTQSVRLLMLIENFGKGKNLCIQTLDGILCHNGEFVNKKYYPKKKTKEEFLNDYYLTYREDFDIKKLLPMTLEGCVVRISDVIGYLGRDIEDAVRVGLININQIPEHLVKILGKNNKEIVNTIVNDIIENSFEKPYIKISDNVFQAIKELMEFNRTCIYKLSCTEEESKKYKMMFNKLYDCYLKAIEDNDKENSIFKKFLNLQNEEYKKEDPKRIVIDFIANMTDYWFLKEFNKYIGEK